MCGRSTAGRLTPDGRIIIQAHTRYRAGTRPKYVGAFWCKGGNKPVAREEEHEVISSLEIETLRGALRVRWPDPLLVYGDDVLAWAYDPLQDRTPMITLNDVEIDAGQARQIIGEMRRPPA